MFHLDTPDTEISFHAEGLDFSLPNPKLIEGWIIQTALKEGRSVGALNIIFCSDAYLYDMNVEYLQHDTFTDVITFQYHDETALFIEGDIFISVERIEENAAKFEVLPEEELRRVIIHGTLHLLGYGDKSPEEKTLMTEKENIYLKLWDETDQ